MEPMKPAFPCLLLALACLPVAAHAQSASISATEQEEQRIQERITQGITDGSLSAAQIQALEAREQALQSGAAVGGNTAGNRGSDAALGNRASDTGLGHVGTPTGETLRPLQNDANGLARSNDSPPAPTTTQTRTGPDPFTYNSLGPDAYQAQ